MSKIEQLIQQYCPDGVEFTSLKNELKVTIGEFVHKEKQSDDSKYPVFNGGISPTGYYDEYNNTGSKIIISARGANAGFVNRIETEYWAGNSCYSLGVIDETRVNYNFIFYYLKDNQSKFIEQQQKGGIPAVSKKQVEEFSIPIPPLPIQQEIVTILDKFTALEAELEAELEARSRQYEYYRNQLLAFEGAAVEWKTLGEVAFYPKKRISYDNVNLENYVGVENLLQNKQGKTFSSYVPSSGNLIQYLSNDILIGNIRPYLKKIWVSDINGGTNGDVLVIRIQEEFSQKIKSRYLFYLLSSDDFFKYSMQFAKGAKMPRGDKDAILKFKIPIPSLEEQERIVNILDQFDALVNDIKTGLPAEIKARRAQYEYYRKKMLTFNRVN